MKTVMKEKKENGPPHAKDLRAAGRRSIIHLYARLRKRCIPLDWPRIVT
jgi:hypothetical protein